MLEDICNLSAEKSVLGSILLYPNLFDDVTEELVTEDFFYNQNKILFQTFKKLCEDRVAIDLITVIDSLKKDNVLEEIGGESYLGELMQSVVSVAHLKQYCKLIADASIRRRLILASNEIAEIAKNKETDSEKTVALAEELILNLREKKSSTLLTAKESVFNVYSLLDKGKAEGIETGFIEVDNIIGGLRPSELIIVAARPGMGKTAFVANVANYIAIEKNKNVLFVSLEMSSVELTIRLISSLSDVSLESVRRGLNKVESGSFVESGNRLSTSKLFLDDSPRKTVAEIGSQVRRLKRKNSIDLLIVDYLGLIEPEDTKEPRQEQVAKITRRLKLLAKEANIPVLVTAQLNRNLEQTKDFRPRLSHLRESGAIEQDADIVILLHREEYYIGREEAIDRGVADCAEAIVAKQRNGKTGTANLKWSGETCRFLNWQPLEEFSSYSDNFPDSDFSDDE